MNLLFFPSGRITPEQFLRGALVLIAIGAAIQLLPLISLRLSLIFSLLGVVTIWCWVVLWVKRFHDGGQSGWMTLLVILVWIVLGFIANSIVQAMFLGDIAEQTADMVEAMEDIDDDNVSGVFTAMFDMMGGMARKLAIPTAISSALVALGVTYGANALIKHDPDENQWGPGSVGDTFD